MSEDKAPKAKFTDLELEEIFYEKLQMAAISVVETNQRAILRDLRRKLQTQFDGSLKVTFTADLVLNSDNEMTIAMGCKYDVKATHKNSLPKIEIKPDNQPDMFEGQEQEEEQILLESAGDDNILPKAPGDYPPPPMPQAPEPEEVGLIDETADIEDAELIEEEEHDG